MWGQRSVQCKGQWCHLPLPFSCSKPIPLGPTLGLNTPDNIPVCVAGWVTTLCVCCVGAALCTMYGTVVPSANCMYWMADATKDNIIHDNIKLNFILIYRAEISSNKCDRRKVMYRYHPGMRNKSVVSLLS